MLTNAEIIKQTKYIIKKTFVLICLPTVNPKIKEIMNIGKKIDKKITAALLDDWYDSYFSLSSSLSKSNSIWILPPSKSKVLVAMLPDFLAAFFFSSLYFV